MKLNVVETWKNTAGKGSSQIMLKVEDGTVRSLVAWAALLKRSRSDVYAAYKVYRNRLPSKKILFTDDRKRKDSFKLAKVSKRQKAPVLIEEIETKNDHGRSEFIYLDDEGNYYDTNTLAVIACVSRSCMATRIYSSGFDNEHLLRKGKQFGKRLDGTSCAKSRKKRAAGPAGNAAWQALSDVPKVMGLKRNGSWEDRYFSTPVAGSGAVQQYL